MEHLQVGQVVAAGSRRRSKSISRDADSAASGPGHLGGTGDAQQVAQHAAGRIRLRVTGRAAHPR